MTDPLPFENKIVLVTGSGRGIGQAIALHFARQGADIVVNFFRNRAPADATVEMIQSLGRQALAVKANVGEPDGIDFLFNEVKRYFDGLDILVHNAASGYNRPVMQQKQKGWDWTMNINARSLLFSAQRAVPLMEARGGGAIVSITSPGSSRVFTRLCGGRCQQSRPRGSTRYLAVELAPRNIVVNAVSPGVIETDALKHFDTMQQTGIAEHILAHTPAGRMVTPEDVAGVTAFLCSPAACMIRGQVIQVDGGYLLPMRGG